MAKKRNQVGAFASLLIGGSGYLVTQLVKLILLATFVPETEVLKIGEVNVIQEVLKMIIGVVDVIGFFWVLKTSKSSKELKVIGTSLGWSTTENLFTKFLPLFIGARELEFSWKHTLLSFCGNLAIVLFFFPSFLFLFFFWVG